MILLDLVFCSDIRGPWRLFIDSSEPTLKCVLSNNRKKYGSISNSNSTRMKGEYETISLAMTTNKYEKHQPAI